MRGLGRRAKHYLEVDPSFLEFTHIRHGLVSGARSTQTGAIAVTGTDPAYRLAGRNTDRNDCGVVPIHDDEPPGRSGLTRQARYLKCVSGGSNEVSSPPPPDALLAQSAEQRILNPRVAGSSPAGGIDLRSCLSARSVRLPFEDTRFAVFDVSSMNRLWTS